MEPTILIIAVVLIVVIMGVIMAPRFARRKQGQKLQDKFGPEYDRTVQTAGNEKKAQAELKDQQKQ
jgi:hypothetical protein